jgi:hypothetical protein
MTATFKTLIASLILLAHGAALAAPVAPPQAQAPETIPVSAPSPVKEHLAWQRVGAPLMEA